MELKTKLKHKLNIQFFADEPPAPPELSLDDFMSKFKADDILGHSAIQSALDSRIGKATSTAITNARAKWEEEMNTNLTEAEKLAKMTKEEKERYQFKKDKESLASEKAKFEREKLLVATGKELNSLGINADLAEYIVGKDADETKTKMDAFTKLFNEAVESSIDEKLKGKTTIKKALNNEDDALRQEIQKSMGLK